MRGDLLGSQIAANLGAPRNLDAAAPATEDAGGNAFVRNDIPARIIAGPAIARKAT
jgi:hypothetical protein